MDEWKMECLHLAVQSAPQNASQGQILKRAKAFYEWAMSKDEIKKPPSFKVV